MIDLKSHYYTHAHTIYIYIYIYYCEDIEQSQLNESFENTKKMWEVATKKCVGIHTVKCGTLDTIIYLQI